MSKKGIELYLVGGYLRDALLGRDTGDIDFTFRGDVVHITKQYAGKINGSFVLLDEKSPATRIVISQEGRIWHLDFTKMAGKTMTEDLHRRDFTFNAMALDLGEFFTGGKVSLLDPFGGVQDLKSGIVRMIREKSFVDDPLRLLRAFRFAANLGFKIEKNTKDAIFRYADLISRTSGERIRDELFLILDSEDSCRFLLDADRCGLIERIFPGISRLKKEKEIWMHSFSTLRYLEKILNKKVVTELTAEQEKEALSCLAQAICDRRKKIHLLKLACLLHDFGKPHTKKVKGNKWSFIGHEQVGAGAMKRICRHLHLSNKETRILEGIVRYHMRFHYLANLQEISERAISKFIRDCEEELIELLFLSFADFLATPSRIRKQGVVRYRSVLRKIFSRYLSAKKIEKLPRLITGYDLIEKFSMKEGPLIGKILEEVELARAEGKISTREQAFNFVKSMIHTV